MATLHHSNALGGGLVEAYPIRKVGVDAPFRWLSKGLGDLKAAPLPSLLYGFVFVAIGLGLLALAASKPVFVLALLSGFLLVGPFVAVGLYDLSHRLEEGQAPTLAHAFSALKFNTLVMAGFAMALGLVMVFWVRSAAVLTGLFFGDASLLSEGWGRLFTSPESFDFMLAFVLFGFALAVVVFSISVVSLPMINHRKVDIVTAIVTSLRAVMMNPLPMLIWAGLIVGLIGLGMAFFYIGLVVTLPIVGHASWHAYRELVGDNSGD
jgi:uncharacterized membrane protein